MIYLEAFGVITGCVFGVVAVGWACIEANLRMARRERAEIRAANRAYELFLAEAAWGDRHDG